MKAIAEKTSKKKQRKSWSKETRINDITKEIRVEELDNKGYLVNINEHGEVKGRWFSEESKYYSETNPLEPEEDTTTKQLESILSNKKKTLIV